jgi:hypothetical protein
VQGLQARVPAYSYSTVARIKIDLREAYASTALASLEWSEERERAVDRVAAAGRADPLGVLLWKAKYQLESKAYQDAHKTLVAQFRARYCSETAEIADRCVYEALSEFMGPACQDCNGARELIVADLRIECEACNGTGIRRYTDFERARRMEISLSRVRVLSGKLRWLACELGSLDRAVNSVLNEELER